jgi:hypothetical protein
MFCPGCGLEEIQRNQYCRACGTELRSVRAALEKPDNITASAISAREEIGRAVAAKIRETQTASELKKVVESVLPEIEKFLESPQEKRLRGIRHGVVVSSIGIGSAIAFSIASVLMRDPGIFMVAGAGLVTFFIGLSFVINAMLFSNPKKSLPDRSDDAQNQRELDSKNVETGNLILPESNAVFSSVTEETTRQLKEKQPVSRRE